MNIIQIQNDLKNVPDQVLINYVKNPTGHVPTYLALGELNRRKEMRANYAKNNPPKSTVAQDLEQQAQLSGLAMLAKNPQSGAPTSQGVADLPTGNMFNEQSYAGGGIVAFADNPNQPVSTDMPGSSLNSLLSDYVVPSMSPAEYWQNLQSNIKSLDEDKGMFKNPIKSIRAESMYRNLPTPYDEAIKYYQKKGLDTPVAELQMQKYNWLRSKQDPTETMEQTGTRIKGVGSPVAKPLTLEDISSKLDSNKSTDAANAVKEAATGKKVNDEPYMAPEVGVSGNLFDFNKRPEDVAEAERDRYQKMYGDDPFIKRGQERLSKLDARAGEMEKQDIPTALIAAGATMMKSTSPYWNVGVGSGVEAGLKSHADTEKQLMDIDEKRFNMDSKIGDAQRAVKIAAINHGLKSEEYNKAANDLRENEIIKGKLDMEKYKILAGTNETKMIMAHKAGYEKDRATYLQNNWNIKHAVDVFNNPAVYRTLSPQEKAVVDRDVKAYRDKLEALQLAYPYASMAVPNKDPMALLRQVS